jgi:acyl-coenzyme A thioesterase PaaI-like protein
MMELNDNTDYQLCFACGQKNPFGLHMVFYQEGEAVVSDFLPLKEHQGFPGVIHGGVIATVFDEALNRTSMLANHPTWTMTGRLEVRYRRYVPYGPQLRVKAWLGLQKGRMMQAHATLTLANDEHTLLAEAQGSFIAVKPEVLDELMKDYPSMRTFFEQEASE